MGKHDVLTKTLAVVGTILVAVPILLPLVTGLFTIGQPGGFRMDYLMPFEVYPITLAGLASIMWAAIRARIRRRPVAISIAVMLGGVVLGAFSAQATGIANSEATLETWRYVVTSAFGVASLLGQIALVVYGSLLSRDLMGSHEETAPPVTPAGI